jgi:phenylacetate-CoA ligase
MHGLSLIYILRDLQGVRFFKVVQESRARTCVQLVIDGTFAPDSIARIIMGFKQRLGADVQVTVELVDNIPAEKSGKFRYIISHA